ncbi:hypothetical protein NC653_035303 [Populus alba x Populus x berolinensis]|uniref:Uncharacterized protein n=1 Tax=Populus alba x Populus x berolinensis TaxID=444605 RepID=A0AAD6LPT8_9ROSI|nr:hypothetical protein NC653_035303 [Populus alba x Populus x berolinensis]
MQTLLPLSVSLGLLVRGSQNNACEPGPYNEESNLVRFSPSILPAPLSFTNHGVVLQEFNYIHSFCNPGDMHYQTRKYISSRANFLLCSGILHGLVAKGQCSFRPLQLHSKVMPDIAKKIINLTGKNKNYKCYILRVIILKNV